MISLGLLGARGRMGQWVSKLALGEYGDSVKLAVSVSSGEGVDALLATEVVIDFSSPTAMRVLAETALSRAGKLPAFVIGSTGWAAADLAIIQKLSEKTPVLMASNFSTGVAALLQILKSATPLLRKLGYSPVIVEAHHRHKKDAPSGTALSIQRVVGTDTQTHSIRSGEVIGDHEVGFYGTADKLSIGHFAQDRSVFARGALDVAIWLASGGPSRNRGRVLSMEDYFKELSA